MASSVSAPMRDYDEDELEGGPQGSPLEADPQYLEAIKRLSEMDDSALVAYGRNKLLVTLIARLEAGMASHQEMAVLRQVLRDGGLTMVDPPNMKTIEHMPVKGVEKPKVMLPIFAEDDE